MGAAAGADGWAGLLVDAGTPAGAADRYAAFRPGPQADWLGGVLVGDDELTALGRTVAGDPIPVVVRLSGGAGGLLAAARRAVAGVRTVRVVSTLRDLDDLAGNAARVVAAADGLVSGIEVAVELPWAPGWEIAAEVVEAAGLTAAVRPHPRLTEQLHTLVELDLGFHLLPGLDPAALPPLLDAVTVLIEDADVDRADELLTAGAPAGEPAAATTAAMSDPPAVRPIEPGRLRRRLRSVAVADVDRAAAYLTGWLGLPDRSE